jgi:hypothetical protein
LSGFVIAVNYISGKFDKPGKEHMVGLSYQDFDLVIEHIGENRYRAHTQAAGETAESVFELPFNHRSSNYTCCRWARCAAEYAGSDQTIKAAREFGGRLYQSVFNPPLKLPYAAAWQPPARPGCA